MVPPSTPRWHLCATDRWKKARLVAGWGFAFLFEGRLSSSHLSLQKMELEVICCHGKILRPESNKQRKDYVTILRLTGSRNHRNLPSQRSLMIYRRQSPQGPCIFQTANALNRVSQLSVCGLSEDSYLRSIRRAFISSL